MNSSNHFVLDLPETYSLLRELKNAKRVTIVTAFAKRSGWHQIRESIIAGKAKIEIVVGLNFGITEPAVLEDWLNLTRLYPLRFKVAVAPEVPVFHPKVLVVERQDSSAYAILGSGNLTGGGLSENIECGVHLSSSTQVEALLLWKRGLTGFPLTQALIDRYRPQYREAMRAAWTTRRYQKSLLQSFNQPPSDGIDNDGKNWSIHKFIRDLFKYVQSQEGIDGVRDRELGAREIATLLNFPDCRFSRKDWETFYKIREFGTIRQSYKDMSSELLQLRNVTRMLISPLVTEAHLESIITKGGEHHIHGLGDNLATKILTSSDRTLWLLFNRRVQTALSRYGLSTDKGPKGYFKLVQKLKHDLTPLWQLDFWAIDAFCEHISRLTEKQYALRYERSGKAEHISAPRSADRAHALDLKSFS